MALSFLYLTTRRFLRVLLGSLRSEHAKDIEIAVLRHQLAVLRLWMPGSRSWVLSCEFTGGHRPR